MPYNSSLSACSEENNGKMFRNKAVEKSVTVALSYMPMLWTPETFFKAHDTSGIKHLILIQD